MSSYVAQLENQVEAQESGRAVASNLELVPGFIWSYLRVVGH